MKGKGEMRTYWLVGEDSERRLARIREEMISSSFASFGSSRKYKLHKLVIKCGGYG